MYKDGISLTLYLIPLPKIVDPIDISVHHPSTDSNQFIWHQCLCHMHTQGMGHIIKVVTGILPISEDTGIDGCETFSTWKTDTRTIVSGNISKDTIEVWQLIGIYWKFMTKKSHGKDTIERLGVING